MACLQDVSGSTLVVPLEVKVQPRRSAIQFPQPRRDAVGDHLLRVSRIGPTRPGPEPNALPLGEHLTLGYFLFKIDIKLNPLSSGISKSVIDLFDECKQTIWDEARTTPAEVARKVSPPSLFLLFAGMTVTSSFHPCPEHSDPWGTA